MEYLGSSGSEKSIVPKTYVDKARVVTGTIALSDAWSGSGPFMQTVTVTGATVTTDSKVDLQPDNASLTQLMADGVSALWIVNNNGALTAYALGAAPTAAMTLQCTITEVL